MNKIKVLPKYLFITFVALIFTISCLCSCAFTDQIKSDINQQLNHSSANTTSSISSENTDEFTWIEEEAPNYYKVVGEAEQDTFPGYNNVMTNKLDDLQRTQAVSAMINYKMVKKSAGWREDFKSGDNPSGWPVKNKETTIITPNGNEYHGWFWNRSHLVADSLGGHAVRENAITGTRMQNVGANDNKNPGGMAYIETKVRNFLYENKDQQVYYKAEPIYKDDELIPRAVIVDALSDDKTINERVIVYNAAKGYEINYHNGEFTKVG